MTAGGKAQAFDRSGFRGGASLTCWLVPRMAVKLSVLDPKRNIGGIRLMAVSAVSVAAVRTTCAAIWTMVLGRPWITFCREGGRGEWYGRWCWESLDLGLHERDGGEAP